MSNSLWRRYLRRLAASLSPKSLHRQRFTDRRPVARVILEELESRLAPAGYVSPLNLAASQSSAITSVIFFESSVADYRTLLNGLPAGTTGVVLDNSGNGLDEMAAFLADQHGLASIGVVAHGSAGAIDLGSATLDGRSLVTDARDLAAWGPPSQKVANSIFGVVTSQPPRQAGRWLTASRQRPAPASPLRVIRSARRPWAVAGSLMSRSAVLTVKFRFPWRPKARSGRFSKRILHSPSSPPSPRKCLSAAPQRSR